MKYQYLGLILSGLPLCASAQITLTQADNTPAFNSQFVISRQMSFTDPGPMGTGQNWDFNTLGGLPDTIFVENAGAVAGTHLLRDEVDSLYYEVTNEGMFLVKEEIMMSAPAVPPEPVTVNYTGDGVEVLDFPATFGATWQGAVLADYTLQGEAFTRSGTINGMVDGEGMITMPSGTYDALRVHTLMDTDEIGTISGINITGERRAHTWSYYTQWLKHPLLKIIADTISVTSPFPTSLPSGRVEWLDEVSVGVIESIEQNEAFGLWPTPARDVLNITLPVKAGAKVQGVLRDLTGRTVREWSLAPIGNTSVDINGLPAGQYFLQVIDGSTEIGVRKVIVH